jgi:ABC-2 type transport system permease protein
MKELRFLLMRNLMVTRRNPVFIFMGLTTPVLYLLLFAPLLKNIALPNSVPTAHVLTLFVPGMLTSLAFSSGIFSGFSIINELRSGVIERFRVTPASRFALLAGPVLHDVIMTLITALLFVVIALPMGFQLHLSGLLLTFVLLMLLSATTSAFGNAMGLITKSEDKFAPIAHGLTLPVMLLSGMMLPLQLAPMWLQTIAHFNPVYYVVEATRRLALGEISHIMVGYAFLMMLTLSFIVLRWATKVFSKAVM